MAKFAQRTYKGYKFTALVPNFKTNTFEQKEMLINIPNYDKARKAFIKECNLPDDFTNFTHEVVAKTLVVPVYFIEEVYAKYGREKLPTDKESEIDFDQPVEDI